MWYLQWTLIVILKYKYKLIKKIADLNPADWYRRVSSSGPIRPWASQGDDGRHCCTDDGKTAIPINACDKLSVDRCIHSVYYGTTDEPQRRAGNRASAQQSRRDTDLRVKYNDTRTAAARRWSCMLKHTDGDAKTARYDAVTRVGQYKRKKLHTHRVLIADDERI